MDGQQRKRAFISDRMASLGRSPGSSRSQFAGPAVSSILTNEFSEGKRELGQRSSVLDASHAPPFRSSAWTPGFDCSVLRFSTIGARRCMHSRPRLRFIRWALLRPSPRQGCMHAYPWLRFIEFLTLRPRIWVRSSRSSPARTTRLGSFRRFCVRVSARLGSFPEIRGRFRLPPEDGPRTTCSITHPAATSYSARLRTPNATRTPRPP
jgi:hypothetical protein